MMEAEKSQNLQPGNKRNRKVNGVVPSPKPGGSEKKETKEKPNLKTTKGSRTSSAFLFDSTDWMRQSALLSLLVQMPIYSETPLKHTSIMSDPLSGSWINKQAQK